MKRFLWILLVTAFSLNMVGVASARSMPVSTSSTTIHSLELVDPLSVNFASPQASVLSIPKYNKVCKRYGLKRICASVSNPYPSQYTNVTVYARLVKIGVGGIKGKPMRAVWHYKTVTRRCFGTTNRYGVAKCKRYISGATKGYTVYIDVIINNKFTVRTSFTPR